MTCSPKLPSVLGKVRSLKETDDEEQPFTEEQIIGILREHAAGCELKELCRKHGISDATFYKWRSKYGGMEVSDARKLKGRWRKRTAS